MMAFSLRKENKRQTQTHTDRQTESTGHFGRKTKRLGMSILSHERSGLGSPLRHSETRTSSGPAFTQVTDHCLKSNCENKGSKSQVRKIQAGGKDGDHAS